MRKAILDTNLSPDFDDVGGHGRARPLRDWVKDVML